MALSVLYANEKNTYYNPDYLSGLLHALLRFFPQAFSKYLYTSDLEGRSSLLGMYRCWLLVLRYLPTQIFMFVDLGNFWPSYSLCYLIFKKYVFVLKEGIANGIMGVKVLGFTRSDY